jgi:hypothetical protein
MTDKHREPRGYRSSGLYALQTRLAMVDEGQDWTDALGPAVGQALRVWRADLIDALGGEAAVSPQVRALVEVAVRTHLMLESVDAYILSLPTLVNVETKSIYPVVLERRRLADGLVRCLVLLGLEWTATPVPKLRDLLRAAGEGETS